MKTLFLSLIAIIFLILGINHAHASGKITVGPEWYVGPHESSSGMGMEFELIHPLVGPFIGFKSTTGLGNEIYACKNCSDETNFYHTTNGLQFAFDVFTVDAAFDVKYVTPYKEFENMYFLKASALLWK
jgi:hypothetical protein